VASRRKKPERLDLAIMHGRNAECIPALVEFFQQIPLNVDAWDETPKGTLTINQIVRQKELAKVVLVVLSGDDIVELAPAFTNSEKQPRFLQARANVIHELGIAQHQKPEHTIVLCIGESELPSNLEGIHTRRLKVGMSKAQMEKVLAGVTNLVLELTGASYSAVKISPLRLDLAPFRAALSKAQAAKESLDFTRECYVIGHDRKAVDFSDIQLRFVEKVYTPKMPSAQRSVRVFGFTFTAFWMAVKKVLGDSSLSDWIFDLNYISPAFVCKNPRTFGDYWQSDADQRERDMKKWFAAKTNVRSLAARNVNVRVRSYNAVPFLHGKLWGDGTVFFHPAQWDGDNRLDYPHSFHEIIPSCATSDRAKAYRALFHNWIQHYDLHTADEMFASDGFDWNAFVRSSST
jgi:hypothetical protein